MRQKSNIRREMEMGRKEQGRVSCMPFVSNYRFPSLFPFDLFVLSVG